MRLVRAAERSNTGTIAVRIVMSVRPREVTCRLPAATSSHFSILFLTRVMVAVRQEKAARLCVHFFHSYLHFTRGCDGRPAPQNNGSVFMYSPIFYLLDSDIRRPTL